MSIDYLVFGSFGLILLAACYVSYITGKGGQEDRAVKAEEEREQAVLTAEIKTKKVSALTEEITAKQAAFETDYLEQSKKIELLTAQNETCEQSRMGLIDENLRLRKTVEELSDALREVKEKPQEVKKPRKRTK